MSQAYQKRTSAKATVGEAQQVAQSIVYPAIVGARFALIVACLAMVVASVALAMAIGR